MAEQFVAEEMLKDPVFSPEAGAANNIVGMAGPPVSCRSDPWNVVLAASTGLRASCEYLSE